MADQQASQGQPLPQWNTYISHTINGVSWTMTGVAAVFLWARMGSRIYRKRPLWWDDRMLILAWLAQLGLAICLSVQVDLGFSQPPPLIKPSHDRPIAQLSNFTTALGALASAWSKTSFALTLMLISSRKMKWGLWALIIIVNVVQVLYMVLTFAHCKITPFDANWNARDRSTCWDPAVLGAYAIFACAVSATCDLVMAVLPWFIVYKLNMKLREKIGVAVFMSLGIAAAVVTIYRTYVVHNLVFQLNGKAPGVYDGWKLNVWAQIEIGATIIAAAIPSLRSSFKKMRTTMNKKYPSKPGSHQLEHLSDKYAGSGSRHGGQSYRWGFGDPDTRDDGSESSIVHVDRSEPGGIMATKEFRVVVNHDMPPPSARESLPPSLRDRGELFTSQ